MNAIIHFACRTARHSPTPCYFAKSQTGWLAGLTWPRPENLRSSPMQMLRWVRQFQVVCSSSSSSFFLWLRTLCLIFTTKYNAIFSTLRNPGDRAPGTHNWHYLYPTDKIMNYHHIYSVETLNVCRVKWDILAQRWSATMWTRAPYGTSQTLLRTLRHRYFLLPINKTVLRQIGS